MEKPIKVHPDLLRASCLNHGLFDGEICPLCEALDPVNIIRGIN